jgi:2-C-methyl-D-erythritol 4-phosphate cytidylyltransferase
VVRDTAVLVPAGGIGTRLRRATPKQFLAVGDVPILVATVRHFVRHPAVSTIVVAAPGTHMSRARRLLAPLGRRRLLTVVAGGPTRQTSVRLALETIPAEAQIILVHDAVRPFITRGLIDVVLAAARAHGAAICGLPIAETVKRVSGDFVVASEDRAGLWAVQTPQAFRAALLREAHEKAHRDGFLGTDDAMLVERLGHPVCVVPGHETNVKITTPADLRRARAWVSR